MRKSRLAALALVPAFAVIGAAPTHAAAPVTNLFATLNGANEIFPAASPKAGQHGAGDLDGKGRAHIRITGTKLCWNFSAVKIGTPVAAHIHSGAAGVNGAVVVPLTVKPGCVTVTQALATSIKAAPSQFYVNVHTAPFPGGAIRGQLAHA
ncbi:MAG: CHRD domain-containing protein [Mycobacteriales bacterium]